MVDPQQVQDRCLHVVYVHLFADRGEAQIVGTANNRALLKTAAGHEQRIGINVMIAADFALLAHLTHRRAAKLAAPHNKRPVEQAALFQVGDQRAGGLVDFPAHVVERRTVTHSVCSVQNAKRYSKWPPTSTIISHACHTWHWDYRLSVAPSKGLAKI